MLKFGYTILSFVKAFCLMQIIYIFTSQYISFLNVSESLAAFINLLINIYYIEKKDGNKDIIPNIYIDHQFLIIIEIIALCIIIFGTLMYNEVIIINKWKLNEYTKKGLLTKAENDFKTTDEDDVQDNEDNKKELLGIELNNGSTNKL